MKREITEEEVCRIFGVPPKLLQEKLTYEQLEVFRNNAEIIMEQTIKKFADRFAEEIVNGKPSDIEPIGIFGSEE